jgi:hypothetical protein
MGRAWTEEIEGEGSRGRREHKEVDGRKMKITRKLGVTCFFLICEMDVTISNDGYNIHVTRPYEG